MSEGVTFGVVGGYGETGKVVVSELWKSGGGAIRVGGRNLERARAVAAQFDGRVSAAPVDVLDAASLEEFCRQSSVVVNCASPVMVLQDRVAQAARRTRRHYVDAAGLLTVKEGLLPHAGEITEAGLSFVISAGWLPGMSELLPAYAAAHARREMDRIDSVTVYIGDADEWSANALREAVWVIRKLRASRQGYYCNGQWVRRLLPAWRKKDLGGQVGVRRFTMFATPEMSDFAAGLKDCTFTSYGCVPGTRTAVAAALAALPLPLGWCARRLGNALRRNRLPIGGFVAVEVAGRKAERRATLSEQMVYPQGRGYWMNGLVLATVARLIATGRGIASGLHFLPEAVDPEALMAALRQAGIEQTEKLAASARAGLG